MDETRTRNRRIIEHDQNFILSSTQRCEQMADKQQKKTLLLKAQEYNYVSRYASACEVKHKPNYIHDDHNQDDSCSQEPEVRKEFIFLPQDGNESITTKVSNTKWQNQEKMSDFDGNISPIPFAPPESDCSNSIVESELKNERFPSYVSPGGDDRELYSDADIGAADRPSVATLESSSPDHFIATVQQSNRTNSPSGLLDSSHYTISKSMSSLNSGASCKGKTSNITSTHRTDQSVSLCADSTTQDTVSNETSPDRNDRSALGLRTIPGSHHRASRQNLISDTDSIGSATSIMMRSHSKTGRSRGNKSSITTDPDDEILVGDEKCLHDAARRGECNVVEQLLVIGTDVNCRNETDRTPLHWVAGNGHLELLKLLLSLDANIEAADKFGMNALLWAAWFGHNECIRLLLRAGSKPTSRNKNGYTFLHCAAQNGHSLIEEILTEDLQDFDRNAIDDAGRTCLHIAAKFGKKRILEKFISLNCDINAKDKAYNTPLHLAAKYGFFDIVAILLNAEADGELKNLEHKTALHLAAEEGNVEAVKTLIQAGVDVNSETEDEVCPLHLAVSAGHEEVAIALLDGGADADSGNKHNQTPLHLAVMNHQAALVQILMTHDADPNIQDARREIPLHLAAENGQSDITEMLLRYSVNLSITDQQGKTPLNVAARGSFTTIVDMIIKAERHQLFSKTVLSDPGDVVDAGNSVRDFGDPINIEASHKPDNAPETRHIRSLLYKLATKHLKRDEWKKLAFHWNFADSQVQAIEEQYTGEKSYREHGYRMLLIWLDGCILRGQNPTKLLFEGLLVIKRKDLAESMRSKANSLSPEKSCTIV